MNDLDDFTAAYMTACKDRPADWNEIGYWYARQLWEAATKREREACAALVKQMGDWTGGHGEQPTPGPSAMAAAIRSRA